MAYVAGGLGGPFYFGAALTGRKVYSYDTIDTYATVVGSQYFNDPVAIRNFNVGDVIIVGFWSTAVGVAAGGTYLYSQLFEVISVVATSVLQPAELNASFDGAATVAPLGLPPMQIVANAAAGAATAAVGDITGSEVNVLKLTAVGAANYTTRTAAQMFADIPGAYVGMVFEVIIENTNAGTTTVVGGTGVTVTGTATIAQSTSRVFTATFTANNALTLESRGLLTSV